MSASSFKDAGNKALQAGDFDEAIKQYSQAITLDPKDHVFYSNRSAAYLSKGDAESALQDASKCIEINATWPKGYSRKGAALHALKLYEEAYEAYSDGLVHAPNDSGLQSGLKEVKKLLAQASSRGGAGFGGGLFGPQALAKLARHPKFGPRMSDPAFLKKLQVFNNPSDASAMFSDPEIMEILQVLIGRDGYTSDMPQTSSNYQSNAPPKPEPVPEPAVELTEEEKAEADINARAAAAKERGNSLYKQKKFDEAIAAYDEAFAICPTNITYLNNKAAVLIEQGEALKAIALCHEALEIGKSSRASFEDKAKVYQRIAAAYLKLDDIDAAIETYGKSQMEMYDKAIERKIKNLELDLKKLEKQRYINPELGAQAKERGNTAFREANFAVAIEEYEEAIKRDPTNAAYYNNLAAAFLKTGLFNDAKRAVEKSLELDRNYVKAWAKKGDIEFFMKEFHKSLDSYKAGLQIEPGNSLCQQGLAKVTQAIREANSGAVDKERAAHAMADPEIQAILSDPTIRQVLQDLQENPKYGNKALSDPTIRAKIEKLVSAGVLQIQ